MNDKVGLGSTRSTGSRDTSKETPSPAAASRDTSMLFAPSAIAASRDTSKEIPASLQSLPRARDGISPTSLQPFSLYSQESQHPRKLGDNDGVDVINYRDKGGEGM